MSNAIDEVYKEGILIKFVMQKLINHLPMQVGKSKILDSGIKSIKATYYEQSQDWSLPFKTFPISIYFLKSSYLYIIIHFVYCSSCHSELIFLKKRSRAHSCAYLWNQTWLLFFSLLQVELILRNETEFLLFTQMREAFFFSALSMANGHPVHLPRKGACCGFYTEWWFVSRCHSGS